MAPVRPILFSYPLDSDNVQLQQDHHCFSQLRAFNTAAVRMVDIVEVLLGRQ
jgi:hypothetical protein